MRLITILILSSLLLHLGTGRGQMAGAQFKGKVTRKTEVKFRPEAIICLPDNTGYIATDLPYEIVHWDFKTMKELGSTGSRQAPTVALVHDPRGQIYRVSYQGVEIFDAKTGELDAEMRPFRSTAIGAVFDEKNGNLIVLGIRSVYFVDPTTRQLLIETPIAAGRQIASGSVDTASRTLYVTVQPGADNRALAVPVDLDRFTAGLPLELGEAKQFSPLISVPRPGHEEFYLVGVQGEKKASKLFFKAASPEQGEFARLFLIGSAEPPQLVFSPDGRYLVVYSETALSVEGVKLGRGPAAGNLFVFEIDSTPELIAAFAGIEKPRGAAFSADGSKLFVLDGRGTIYTIE